MTHRRGCCCGEPACTPPLYATDDGTPSGVKDWASPCCFSDKPGWLLAVDLAPVIAAYKALYGSDGATDWAESLASSFALPYESWSTSPPTITFGAEDGTTRAAAYAQDGLRYYPGLRQSPAGAAWIEIRDPDDWTGQVDGQGCCGFDGTFRTALSDGSSRYATADCDWTLSVQTRCRPLPYGDKRVTGGTAADGEYFLAGTQNGYSYWTRDGDDLTIQVCDDFVAGLVWTIAPGLHPSTSTITSAWGGPEAASGEDGLYQPYGGAAGTPEVSDGLDGSYCAPAGSEQCP